MNCTGCWNYKQCEKKDDLKLYYCFRKNESVCHYCKYENTCKKACNTMVLCSEWRKDDGK